MPKGGLRGFTPPGERQQAALATAARLAELREINNAEAWNRGSEHSNTLITLGSQDVRRLYTTDPVTARLSRARAEISTPSTSHSNRAVPHHRECSVPDAGGRPSAVVHGWMGHRPGDIHRVGSPPLFVAPQNSHETPVPQMPGRRPTTAWDAHRSPRSQQQGPALEQRTKRLWPRADKVERVSAGRNGAGSRAIAGYAGHMPGAKENLLGTSVWREPTSGPLSEGQQAMALPGRSSNDWWNRADWRSASGLSHHHSSKAIAAIANLSAADLLTA